MPVKGSRKAKGRSTGNSNFQVIPVDSNVTLGTLASETVIASGLTALDDDFWIQSADLQWSLLNAAGGQTPLMFGVANSDLSVTEIDEAIEASPTSKSDIIARERARRPVRKIGNFTGPASDVEWNDGRPMRSTIKMYLAEGVELNAWVKNKSGAVLTTGGIVRVFGNLYGSWR